MEAKKRYNTRLEQRPEQRRQEGEDVELRRCEQEECHSRIVHTHKPLVVIGSPITAPVANMSDKKI